ncbi:MAG: hypothetical protein L0332_30385 [Chloroflexi bacterium]|nr:hypothetical protein [Chloroflexota bacterium]
MAEKSSFVTIGQAVANKYDHESRTNPTVDRLVWAVEQHAEAVQRGVPTVALMFHFAEVYRAALDIVKEWRAGNLGAPGCTLLPMLEAALEVVNVPDMELLENIQIALYLLTDVIVYAPGRSWGKRFQATIRPLAEVGILDKDQLDMPLGAKVQ